MYILNQVSLEEAGFIPGQQNNSNIALSGFLDMPGRLGKTFHDWGLENGIEPYVSADEIYFEGRDLILEGFIKGDDGEDCEIKLQSMFSLINSLKDVTPLSSKWGVNNVIVNGQITVEYLSVNFLKIRIPFREPSVTISGVNPASEDADYGIDGISFKTLGGAFLALSDRRDRPQPKPGQLSAYGKEAYQVTKTVAPELIFKLFIDQPTYALFKEKIEVLQMLFASPSLRTIKVSNDKARTFFVKDGFKVSNLYFTANRFTGIVECKLTEAALFVAKLNQLINFQPFAIKLIDDEDFAPSVSVNSGLPITLTSSNPQVAIIINGMIHIVGAGTSVITASQAGDDTYNPAAPKSQTLTVRNGLMSFPYPLPHLLTQ